MSISLIRSDGEVFQADTQEKADAAVATGHFTVQGQGVPQESNVPPAPDQNAEVQSRLENPNAPPTHSYILKDKESGQRVNIASDLADQAIASGTHTAEDFKDFPLMRADGEIFHAPSEDAITKALQSGKFRLATPEEVSSNKKATEQKANIEENNTLGHAALVGFNQHNPVANIAEKIAPSVPPEYREAEAEAARQKHPYGYYTGAVGGEGTSAVGLGKAAGAVSGAAGLGEAGSVATNVLGKLGSGAAKIATEGAVFSAEPVTTALIDKDPARAAEALALGVGMNFGIHGVFSGIGAVPKLVNKGVEALGDRFAPATAVPSEEAQRLAVNKVLKDSGLNPSNIIKLKGKGQELLQAIGAEVGDTHKDILDKIQRLEDSGPAIGNAIEGLDELNPVDRQPIIEAHLNKAKEDIANAMPSEIKEYETVNERVNALTKRNAELDEPTKRVFEKYLQDVEDFQNQHIAPEKPQELLDHEAAVNEHEKNVYDQAELQRMDQNAGVNGRPVEFPAAPVRPETEGVKEFDAAMKEYEERIKNPIPKPDQPQELLDWAKHNEEFKNALAEQKALPPLPPSAMQAKYALEPMLQEIDASIRQGSFKNTQALKGKIRGQTNFNGGDNDLINNYRKTAYSIVRDNLANAEDAAAMKKGADPAIVQGLRKDRALYTFHSLLKDIADRISAKETPDVGTFEKIFGATRHERALPIIALHMLGVNPVIAVGAGLALPFAKKALAQRSFGKALATALGKTAPNEADTVVHALHIQEIKINEAVKSTIKALGSSAAARSVQSNHDMHGDGMKNMVPDHIAENDRLNTLRNAIADNVSKPDQFASHLGNITSGLRQEGLGQVADEYTQHQLRLMKVLQTILPADPSLAKSHPFAARVNINEISPATKDKYNRALSVASDPTRLLEMVKSNNITASDVAIAAAVNPATLQKIREALVDEAQKSKPNLSYQQRLSLGILMGTNIDESTTQVPILQSVYPPPQPPSAPNGGNALKKGGQSPKMQTGAEERLNNSYLTASEKVLQKL